MVSGKRYSVVRVSVNPISIIHLQLNFEQHINIETDGLT